MAKLFDDVQPGDLIKAKFWNDVLHTLNNFDDRISSLEAGTTGGQIVIKSLAPLTTWHVTDEMHVLGLNFGPVSQVVVTVGGQRVRTFKPGSSNSELIFDIPSVQGLSPQGTLVSLIVSNATSSDSTTFTLLPAPITVPTGSLFVNLSSSPGVGKLLPGNTYLFVFTVAGFTSLTDNYAVTASLDAASKAALWTATPVDPTNPQKTLTSVSIPAGQNTSTSVGVNVFIPLTPVVASAQVSLSLVSSLNPAQLGGNGGTQILPNAAPPPPDKISFAVTFVGANGSISPDQTTISFPPGTTSAVIIITASVPDSASYTVQPLTFSDNTWKATINSSNPFSAAANSTSDIRLTVTPGSKTANLQLKVTEDGNAVAVQGNKTYTINVGS